jgi:putative membrane protein (TIGR04086 family)
MDEGGLSLAAVGRGIVGGFLGALGLAAVATLVLSFIASPASYLGLATVAVAWASVALAGFLAARAAGKGALIHGGVAGGAFLVLALVLGALVLDTGFGATAIPRLAIAVIVGALGGVLGIGL